MGSLELLIGQDTLHLRHRTRLHWGYIALGAATLIFGALGIYFGWTGRAGQPATEMHWLMICVGGAILGFFGITQKTNVDFERGQLRHYRSLLGMPFYLRRVDTDDITAVILTRQHSSRQGTGAKSYYYILAVEMDLDRLRIEYSTRYADIHHRARKLADALDVEFVDMGTDKATFD